MTNYRQYSNSSLFHFQIKYCVATYEIQVFLWFFLEIFKNYTGVKKCREILVIILVRYMCYPYYTALHIYYTVLLIMYISQSILFIWSSIVFYCYTSLGESRVYFLNIIMDFFCFIQIISQVSEMNKIIELLAIRKPLLKRF